MFAKSLYLWAWISYNMVDGILKVQVHTISCRLGGGILKLIDATSICGTIKHFLFHSNNHAQQSSLWKDTRWYPEFQHTNLRSTHLDNRSAADGFSRDGSRGHWARSLASYCRAHRTDLPQHSTPTQAKRLWRNRIGRTSLGWTRLWTCWC